MLKLCSHPLLVVGEKVPETVSTVLSDLFPGKADYISELHNLQHSPKLIALQEILEECGIGIEASSSEGSIAVGQHRVLIFAQHKVIFPLSFGNLFASFFMNNLYYLFMVTSVYPVFWDVIVTADAGFSGSNRERSVPRSYEKVSLLLIKLFNCQTKALMMEAFVRNHHHPLMLVKLISYSFVASLCFIKVALL